MPPYSFKLFDKSIDRNAFDCGVTELNDYFKKFARQNDEKGLAKTFVLVSENAPRMPLGYYTLSSAQIQIEEIPDHLKKRLPKYPVPVVRIGRLAVDLRAKGKGFGKILLLNAFENILKISGSLGVYAVLVDAKDEGAKDFYSKFGFVSLKSLPMSMIIPLVTVAVAFSD